MMRIDAKDRKILLLLQQGADVSLADLSEQVGISKTALHRRIQKLKAAKVIRRFTIQLGGSSQIGGMLAVVSIVKSKASSIDIATKLKKIPQIEKCYSVTGEVSLTTHLRFQATEELQEILEQIQKIPGVDRTFTQLVIEEHFDEPSRL